MRDAGPRRARAEPAQWTWTTAGRKSKFSFSRAPGPACKMTSDRDPQLDETLAEHPTARHHRVGIHDAPHRACELAAYRGGSDLGVRPFPTSM